jgi:hypothetical protein
MAAKNMEAEKRATTAKCCAELEIANRQYINYIKEKTNQLLRIMGADGQWCTELDDRDLVASDPIGIVAESIAQAVDRLEAKNQIVVKKNRGARGRT